MRGAGVIGATVLAAALACGDPYLHTNPYDPLTRVTITVAGPDSLFSYAEVAQFTATEVPLFPDTALQWAVDTVTIYKPGTGDTVVDGANYLKANGAGAFQSIAPPLEPATLTLEVEALIGRIDTTVVRYSPIFGPQVIQTNQYRHIGFTRVVVTQRVTRIQLRCPATHACDTLTAGASWSVWVDGFDAIGHQIVALTGATANPTTGPPVALFTVRDPTIASSSPVGIRATTVTALRSGATWIVAARDSLRDSLQLVVR